MHLYYRPGTYSSYVDADGAITRLSDQIDAQLDPQFEGRFDDAWDESAGDWQDWVEANEDPQDGHVYVLINGARSIEGSEVTSDDPGYCLVREYSDSEYDQADTFRNMVIHEVAHVLGVDNHTNGGVTESTYVHYMTPMITTYGTSHSGNSGAYWVPSDLCYASSTDPDGLTDHVTSCTRQVINDHVANEVTSNSGWW